jgi:hypothetical protein
VEGIDRGLIQGFIPDFVWTDLENPYKISVIMVDVPAEIRTGHFPMTSQKRYRYTALLSSIMA